jgi:hypothetical protein
MCSPEFRGHEVLVTVCRKGEGKGKVRKRKECDLNAIGRARARAGNSLLMPDSSD